MTRGSRLYSSMHNIPMLILNCSYTFYCTIITNFCKYLFFTNSVSICPFNAIMIFAKQMDQIDSQAQFNVLLNYCEHYHDFRWK